MYERFFNKILNSYKKIGFRPQPKCFLCEEEGMCAPLIAIALANGVSSDNRSALTRWVRNYLKGNWIWIEGFNDAFNLNEVTYWKDSPLQYPHYLAGKKVGMEIRKMLKEVYYKKENPA